MFTSDVPQLILLTKVDKLCEEVKADVTNLYKSHAVQKVVEKAAEIFRIPSGNVIPVKNYEGEAQLKDGVSISALIALRQMLNFANDYLDLQRDMMPRDERGIQRLDAKD